LRIAVAALLFLLVSAGAEKLWDSFVWNKPNEAQYRGRPTSWWAMHCQSGFLNVQFLGDMRVWLYRPGKYPFPAWHDWPGMLVYFVCETDTTAVYLTRPDSSALPVLVELLGDNHPAVRQTAVCGLARIAEKDKNQLAISALASRAHDKDWSVRNYTRWALRRLAPHVADMKGIKSDDEEDGN
jgi:hypothetical protein